MAPREAHAAAYHLLRLFEEGKLTEAQDKFLDALVRELERRARESDTWSRCHCRMCQPADPMGGWRAGSTPADFD